MSTISWRHLANDSDQAKCRIFIVFVWRRSADYGFMSRNNWSSRRLLREFLQQELEYGRQLDTKFCLWARHVCVFRQVPWLWTVEQLWKLIIMFSVFNLTFCFVVWIVLEQWRSVLTALEFGHSGGLCYLLAYLLIYLLPISALVFLFSRSLADDLDPNNFIFHINLIYLLLVFYINIIILCYLIRKYITYFNYACLLLSCNGVMLCQQRRIVS